MRCRQDGRVIRIKKTRAKTECGPGKTQELSETKWCRSATGRTRHT